MLSRRRLLAGVPAATALAVTVGCVRGPVTVDPRRHGAVGDGASDDSDAIQAAAAALRSGDTLHFPPGVYRFARRWPPGGAAIVIAGLSDVDIEFDTGAELVMDNLDPDTRLGTSHGVLIRGPAARISLRNVNLRWTGGPHRSFGDGIRVAGYPMYTSAPAAGWDGAPAPISQVTLSDCVIRSSPQAGVIMMGTSDITVTGLTVESTMADGLHFNACRHARVDRYRAVGPGDDGLALVTYFADRFTFDADAHTFAFPTLTDWSNADFDVGDVQVTGGQANGLRISGAHRVSVQKLDVTDTHSGSGFMIDSAEPGTHVGWNYVASRAVRVDTMSTSDCDTGVHLLGRPAAINARQFTDFDVAVGQATLDGSTNWAIRAESLTEHPVIGLRMANCAISSRSTTGGNGGVGIASADGITLDTVSIHHPEPAVVVKTADAHRLSIGILSLNDTAPAPRSLDLERSDGTINGTEFS